MSRSPHVILSKDLGEYFRTEVSEARSNLGIELGDITEYYLVNLLCEFARQGAGPTPGDEPLAFIYKRALEAGAAERVRLFKQLGDLSLYVSGFFAEFVERSLVDMDYYIAMGGNAYSNLSDLVAAQRQGEMFAQLYTQLAHRFTEIVDLLNEIAAKSRERVDDHRELLQLYDRWLRTGSQRIRKLLIEKGLVPTDAIPTEYEQ